MTDNKLVAFIIGCVTVAVIVAIVVLYSSCERQRDRRAECLQRSTAAECELLFHEPTGRK